MAREKLLHESGCMRETQEMANMTRWLQIRGALLCRYTAQKNESTVCSLHSHRHRHAEVSEHISFVFFPLSVIETAELYWLKAQVGRPIKSAGVSPLIAFVSIWSLLCLLHNANNFCPLARNYTFIENNDKTSVISSGIFCNFNFTFRHV